MWRLLVGLAVVVGVAGAQGHPRDGEIKDADTRAWWHTTEALAGDSMEGRDVGSAAYGRAAGYVAGRFKAAGLQPAGDAGTFFQAVPMHEVAVDAEGTSFAVLREGRTEERLAFLQEITVGPAANLSETVEGALTFRGYCGKDAMADLAGKIVVCFGTQRQGLPSGGERVASARAGGARGLVNVDDPYFTIEPPRWPAAYARSVALDGGRQARDGGQGPTGQTTGSGASGRSQAGSGSGMPVMRLAAESLAKVLAGSGQDAAALLKAGGAKEKLPSFEIPARLRVRLKLSTRAYSSPNVLGMLPGADASVGQEVVVIAAHLDGYGYGTPVAGDGLYNGALDDAAYVALLIQFAEDLQREHRGLKRSVLFCAFTGEEKGLLGSNYFVDHPTVARERLVADVNLDQLRPLFPLKMLTALAVDDTTLGDTARAVGAGMGISLRADPEPERGLLRRADHYPFLRIGVPAIGFIFGYEPGTEEERRYREWYQVRYHRPQDDLTQPMDFGAAGRFNQFFYKLVEAVAGGPRPELKAGSQIGRNGPASR